MPTNTKALQVAEPAGFIAGKNKFINGDFNINQRAFSSTTTSNVFMFDRWKTECSGGTVTYSAQTFTAGAAPVAGYESTNYLQVVTSGQSGTNYADMYQNIEDVRALAGQTQAQQAQTAAQVSSGIAGQRLAAAQNLASLGQGGIGQALGAAGQGVSAAMTPQQLYNQYASVIFGTPAASYNPDFRGTQGSTRTEDAYKYGVDFSSMLKK